MCAAVSAMGSAGGYSGGTSVAAGDRGEVEYPADPASSAFFNTEYNKNEELKTMLDSSKDSLKLEAMKRIIGMIAKGRDASDLFPAVVKNVVCKNMEVKKLVYVYLGRYAEQQQELALLSVSSFQRALKEPNQLIRACALRVLAGIRVPLIAPIVLVAVREAAADMSPYVRKTAAHAVPKLHVVEPELRDDLIAVIARLLHDPAPLVVGSAAHAFTEVCSERMDLLHGCYRKMCALLADVDEWGQSALLHILARYAAMHFPDPNLQSDSETDDDKPFYENSDSDESSKERGSEKKKKSTSTPSVDPDLRLLLRASKPLLQSRNAAVVVAVAAMHCQLAPRHELPPAAKALVRLLRHHAEVQTVVLHAIVALTATHKYLFEPYLKSFFVRSSDPHHIKLLKLDILVALATETTVSMVLRELQTHVCGGEAEWAAAAVRAIGALALAQPAVTPHALHTLLKLLSSRNEAVVSEAVVVVKRVVCGGGRGGEACDAGERAARLVRCGRVSGTARAAATYLLHEHAVRTPLAPALLAHYLLHFATLEECVKLQVLTLAMKVWVTRCVAAGETGAGEGAGGRGRARVAALCSHALQLARYDSSYEVRDRARLLRRYMDQPPGSKLAAHASALFLAAKPPPDTNAGKCREGGGGGAVQLGVATLSSVVGRACPGYVPPPPRPPHALAAAERDAAAPRATSDTAPPTRAPHAKKERKMDKGFYSDSSSADTDSSSSSESESDEEEEEKEQSDLSQLTDNKKRPTKPKVPSGTSESEGGGKSSSSSDSGSDSSSESDSDSGSDTDSGRSGSGSQDDNPKKADIKSKSSRQDAIAGKSNLDLLLELDEGVGCLRAPVIAPTSLQPRGPASSPGEVETVAAAVRGPRIEVCNHVFGGGLSVEVQFTRIPPLESSKLTQLEVTVTNHTGDAVENLLLFDKSKEGETVAAGWGGVATVPAGGAISNLIALNFNDSLQPVFLELNSSKGKVELRITVQPGETLRPATMPLSRFVTEQGRLRGLAESSREYSCDGLTVDKVQQRVLKTSNLGLVGSDPADTSDTSRIRFAGRQVCSGELVLVEISSKSGGGAIRVHCGNPAAAHLLLQWVYQALTETK